MCVAWQENLGISPIEAFDFEAWHGSQAVSRWQYKWEYGLETVEWERFREDWTLWPLPFGESGDEEPDPPALKRVFLVEIL